MNIFKKDTQLISFSKYFTKVVLRNNKPNKKCFNVCLPLKIYLITYNINTTLMAGLIENTPHYILRLDNNSNSYIDPTIRQFKKYKSKPKVFIGWTQEYDSFSPVSNDNFTRAYEQWLFPLLNNGLSIPILIENHKQSKIEIKSQIKIIIRAYKLISKRRMKKINRIKNCQVFESYCCAYRSIINKIPNNNLNGK